MRRILITPRVETIAAKYADDIKTYDAPAKLLDLKKQIKSQAGAKSYTEYIDDIINNYYNIIIVQPDDFDKYNPDPKLDMSHEFTVPRKKKDGSIKNEKVLFYKLIVEALGYDWVRNHSYPKFMTQLGIRTCVYCNAQYGVSMEKAKGSRIYTSSYEIDHFRPKSKYPYLATSFFNLQPSCSHCNGMKNNNDAEFGLYTKDANDIRPFRFGLEAASIPQFLLTCDSERLNINFDVTDNKYSSLKANHEKRFRISAKYGKHKEEASEIVVMSQIYNKAYIDQLVAEFGNQVPHLRNQILNVVMGFPTHEEEIHKRPLTLMRQDIAKQLGIL